LAKSGKEETAGSLCRAAANMIGGRRAPVNTSGMATRPSRRARAKTYDGRFDFYVVMNGRNDWRDLE
jgi:hypothetical protein